MVEDAIELQSHLLSMMKQLHKVCIENGIKYYILGGTALGAFRHQGFIPWDDDLDIGMLRSDYEKFCKLPACAFPENLELRFYRTVKDSPFHFIKLVDNTTTLIEKEYLNYVEGVYIDIFPLDGAKNYNQLREKIRCNIIWFNKVMIFYHCMTETRKNFLKRILIYIAKKESLPKMHNLMNIRLQKYSCESSEYIANFYGAWREKEIHLKEDLGEPTLYEFEDTKFFGPEKIDKYLTQLYGDYMTLPPKERQVFKHNYYYVNLKESYNNFLKKNNC